MNVATETVMNRLFESAGCSNSRQFSEFLGVVPQSVYDARKKNRIPDGWVRQVAEKTGVSADWLYFGDRGNRSRHAVDKSKDDDGEIMMIPLVDARLSAGLGSFETDGRAVSTFGFRRSFLLERGTPSKMVLMHVSGDSMMPEVMNGDMVLIDQSQKNIYPNGMYAVRVGEAIYVKRIDTTLRGGVTLKSTNTNYDPMDIVPGEQEENLFAVIGRVIWCCRDLH